MSAREYEQWTQDEVAEWPGASVSFEAGGKHNRAVLTFGDASRFVVYPSTPGDNTRGIYNKIGDVRRELAGMGAVRNKRVKSTREPSERNPGADMRQPVAGEPAPVMPDPWEALQALASQPLKSGIHHLTSAEYHADPAPLPSLSSTLAKVITSKSPLHAWHACRRLNPDCKALESKAFDIGTAAHRALLGVGDDYVAIPEELLASNGAASTAAAKAFIAEARLRGDTPLKADEVAQVEAMRDAGRAKLATCGIYLDPARSELAALAEIDGIWCRALFDNAPSDAAQPIYDYKTCEDASPAACLKSIVNYGYDVQAAHYLAVWKAVTGEDRRFVFIFQEKPAPHEVTLIALSGSFLDVGQTRAARARRLWRECLSTNNWPGYPVGLHEVDAPAWLGGREMQEQF